MSAATPPLLSWYPHSPVEWRRITRGLSLQQRGALELARDESWDDATPCTLVDDDEAWKLLLGTEWKKLLAVLRRFFVPCEDHPGRVRWPWLYTLWQGQNERYQKAVRAGSAGGTAPGAKRGRKPGNSNRNSTGNSTANSNRIAPEIAKENREGVSPPSLRDVGVNTPPASDDAPLTPGGVASPSATGRDAPNGAPADWLTLARQVAAELALPEPLADRVRAMHATVAAPNGEWACDATPPCVPDRSASTAVLEPQEAAS